MRRLRHSLFLVWLVASAVWIGMCLWMLDFLRLQPSAEPWCDQRTGPPLSLPYGIGAIVATFGVPIVALLAVAVIFMLIRAIRRNS